MEKITAYAFGIVIAFIGIVIVFSIIGNMGATVIDASNAANNPNNCSGGLDATNKPLTLNYSSLSCKNSSGNDQYAASIQRLPLSALFAPSGILLVILMIVIFLAVIIFIVHKMRAER